MSEQNTGYSADTDTRHGSRLQNRIADLNRQLAEAREKVEELKSANARQAELYGQLEGERDRLEEALEAIREWAAQLAKGHVSGTWQGLVKRDLAAILGEKGA